VIKAVVVDGEVTGTIGSWGDPAEREVTYRIGRSHWGKGIATSALRALLAVDLLRSLHARVAYEPAPPPQAAPAQPDMYEQLKKLAELKGAGILTEEEFAAEKAKILNT
jgi:putative oligomerization/nucleic acid binding protein/GNAT acetyltransferase-like protein